MWLIAPPCCQSFPHSWPRSTRYDIGRERIGREPSLARHLAGRVHNWTYQRLAVTPAGGTGQGKQSGILGDRKEPAVVTGPLERLEIEADT